MYTYNATIINIVDGDTVDAIIDLGFRLKQTVRLRLLGIDAPERGKPGYAEARDYLHSLIFGKQVRIATTKADSFGRYLADIQLINLDGTSVDVGKLMIKNGFAVLYTGRT